MRKSKVLTALICVVLCALIIIFAEPILNGLGYCDKTEDGATLTIHMEQGKNRFSYGREMRIVHIKADDENLDLSLYSDDNWVWHEEWGYVLYQAGDSDYTVNLMPGISNLSIEYVKQDGSGNATVTLDNRYSSKLHMYRHTWLNSILSIQFISRAEKVRLICELCVLAVLLTVLIYRVIYYIVNKPDSVNRVKTSLSMFDFVKGIGIIVVIGRHTLGLVMSGEAISGYKGSIIVGMLAIAAFYTLMPLFYVASGYGMRADGIKKTVTKQLKYLIKPYLLVTAGVLISAIIQLVCVSDFGWAEFKFTMIPFLLANTTEGDFFGTWIGTIGPMWFTVSLSLSWIILNLILNVKNKYIRYGCVVLALIAGWVLGRFNVVYFCLCQSFSVVAFLYAGHEIKNNKLYSGENWKIRIGLIAAGLCFMVMAVINGMPFDIAYNQWGQNYFAAIAAGVLGSVAMMRILLTVDKALGKYVKWIRSIGRYSYYIFYIHTFEYLAIPWERIARMIPGGKLVVWCSIVALRCLIIYGIYRIILATKKKKTAKQA